LSPMAPSRPPGRTTDPAVRKSVQEMVRQSE
jgi:hypothetical protein